MTIRIHQRLALSAVDWMSPLLLILSSTNLSPLLIRMAPFSYFLFSPIFEILLLIPFCTPSYLLCFTFDRVGADCVLGGTSASSTVLLAVTGSGGLCVDQVL